MLFLICFFVTSCTISFAEIKLSPSEVKIDLKGKVTEYTQDWKILQNGVARDKLNFDYYSSNTNVAEVSGSDIIAKSIGVAYITIVSKDDSPEVEYLTVTVVDSTKDPTVLDTTPTVPTTPNVVKTVIKTILPNTTITPVTVAPETTAPTTTSSVVTHVPTTISIQTTATKKPTTKTPTNPTTVKPKTKAPSTPKPTATPEPVKTTRPRTSIPAPVSTPKTPLVPQPVARDYKGVRVLEVVNGILTMTTTEKVIITPETWYQSNNLKNSNFIFYSLNPNVATISSRGEINAVSQGTATICVFATTYMDMSASSAFLEVKNGNGVPKKDAKLNSEWAYCLFDVRVTDPKVVILKDNNRTNRIILDVGEVVHLDTDFVSMNGSDNFIKERGNISFRSANSKIVTSSTDGIIMGQSVGTTTVTATTTFTTGSKISSIFNVIVDEAVNSLNVTPENITIKLGEEYQLETSGVSSSVLTRLLWIPDNPYVAYAYRNGCIRGNAVGTTQINIYRRDKVVKTITVRVVR